MVNLREFAPYGRFRSTDEVPPSGRPRLRPAAPSSVQGWRTSNPGLVPPFHHLRGQNAVFVLLEGIPPLPKTWSSLLRNGGRHPPARHRAVYYGHNTEVYGGTLWNFVVLCNNRFIIWVYIHIYIIICLYRARKHRPISKAKQIRGRDRLYIVGMDWPQQGWSPRGTSAIGRAEAESIRTSSYSGRVRRACVFDTRPERNKWPQYKSAY